MCEDDLERAVAGYLAWVGSAFRGGIVKVWIPEGMADLVVSHTRKGESWWFEAAVERGENAVSAVLSRIEEKLDRLVTASETPPEYLSIKHIARMATVSQSHIRRAIYSGDLAASNVGTPARPVYRIARKDLIEWMERKRGGTTRVPPRSELDELMRRHLPNRRGRNDSATR